MNPLNKNHGIEPNNENFLDLIFSVCVRACMSLCNRIVDRYALSRALEAPLKKQKECISVLIFFVNSLTSFLK